MRAALEGMKQILDLLDLFVVLFVFACCGLLVTLVGCWDILSWDTFLTNLRELEHLLRRRMNRERFIATCIPVENTQEEALITSWSLSLKSLRWEQTVNFCKNVSWSQLQL